jgi:hypothetical protein
MASSLQGALVVPRAPAVSRYRLLDKYFYFAMSLLIAAIVVAGFSRTVNQNLFHPAVPRPFLLWIHAAAFTLWIVFYILQSALVRVRKVKWHRLLGWFGAGLAAVMVPLGFTIAIIMGRFDKHVIHAADADTFLSIPFGDMVIFSVLVGLAIYWRRKPELHRRLLFIGTCGLLDAAFGRFDYLFNHSLFFFAVDGIILLGVARDLLVNRRIHIVYRVALPSLIVVQALMVYLWRGAPAWWSNVGQALLG